MKWIPGTVVLVGVLFAGAAKIQAQVLETRSRTMTTTVTTDQLLERIVALEARLARLEGLLSVVNGTVVLDGRGAPVLLRGGSITIQPDGMLSLRAGSTVSIAAAASLAVRAGATLGVESAGTLDLKGSTIMLNNGARPVLCLGAFTTSVLGTAPHVHQVTGQGCGSTVLVP